MTRRVTASDWCDAGLALLRDEGMSAVTVDRLCTALARTKGSFYHHFRDMDAFCAQLLRRWEQALTDVPITHASAVADPESRAARLDEMVARMDHRLDLAVRAWAVRDSRARTALARVDRRRMAYLATLHADAGSREAQACAQLEYSAFLGVQQLRAVLPPAAATRISQRVMRQLAQMWRTSRSRDA